MVTYEEIYEYISSLHNSDSIYRGEDENLYISVGVKTPLVTRIVDKFGLKTEEANEFVQNWRKINGKDIWNRPHPG